MSEAKAAINAGLNTPMPIAALPMYDFLHVRDQTDQLWTHLAAEVRNHGFAAPECLTRADDLVALWQDSNLLLAQTCGYPLVSQLRDQVTVIGTPDYGVIKDKPGWYNSVVLIRKDDARQALAEFKSATWAYNDLMSQSGCHAMLYAILVEVGEARLFAKCLRSGGHVASVVAVADKRADITAVDAITWRHLQECLPQASQLQILMQTSPTPGLPFISANTVAASTLTDAAEFAIAALSQADRDALGLIGFWRSNYADYKIIRERAEQASGLLTAHRLS